MPAGNKIISLPQPSTKLSPSPRVRVVKKNHLFERDLLKQLRSSVLKAVRAASGSLIREGVLTPGNIPRVLRHMPEFTSEIRSLIIQQVEKRSRKTIAGGILRVVPGDQIILPATTGEEMLGISGDVFSEIDSHCRSYGCNVRSLPTKEMAVKAYDLIKDATVSEIFPSDTDLDRLSLTQGQIGAYVLLHSHMLLEGGYTSFLFKVGTEFFVANVIGVSSKGLRLVIIQLSCKTVLRASSHHRVVIPHRRSVPSKTLRVL